MAIEIVDIPMKHGDCPSFIVDIPMKHGDFNHSYVSFPEGFFDLPDRRPQLLMTHRYEQPGLSQAFAQAGDWPWNWRPLFLQKMVKWRPLGRSNRLVITRNIQSFWPGSHRWFPHDSFFLHCRSWSMFCCLLRRLLTKHDILTPSNDGCQLFRYVQLFCCLFRIPSIHSGQGYFVRWNYILHNVWTIGTYWTAHMFKCWIQIAGSRESMYPGSQEAITCLFLGIIRVSILVFFTFFYQKIGRETPKLVLEWGNLFFFVFDSEPEPLALHCCQLFVSTVYIYILYGYIL